MTNKSETPQIALPSKNIQTLFPKSNSKLETILGKTARRMEYFLPILLATNPMKRNAEK